MIGAPIQNLWFSRRFYEDYRDLPLEIAQKVRTATRFVREHGAYYPSLHTRTVQGNPDARFRFMNVDDRYRMVVALDGRDVLFEAVGDHEPTLKRGAVAVLRELEERLRIDPETFVRPARHSAIADQPTLFGDQPATIAEIVREPEVVADLITGDLFGALEGYRDGLIEDWMVFLSPLQRRAVDRSLNGPTRITGGPGTGKTVVGLHRGMQFAERLDGPRRVLMTSFVRNIPETLDHLFQRLAPEQHERVRFRHIHDLAVDTLRTRDRYVNADGQAARARFDRRWQSNAARASALQKQGFSPSYVWDEITRVIEGRGLDDLQAYLGIQRHGRKRPMQEEARRHTWSLYEEYREACDRLQPMLVDYERLLRLACDAIQAEPTGQRFQAIIVDEAQDVTEVGLRFLLELLEGGATGRLILIGDQAQSIYPGGFRLSDIGVDTRGRSMTLHESYRSTDEIMQAVGALGRALSPDDFGADGLATIGASTVRRGPRPTVRAFPSEEGEHAWVLAELAEDQDLASTGLLFPTNAAVDRWSARLRTAGIQAITLINWRGRPTPGVKLGTYARSKGLEFKRVVLPELDAGFPWADRDDLDGYVLQGSMLYVAMSRARDRLDLSYTGKPSYLLDPVMPFLEMVETSATDVQ